MGSPKSFSRTMTPKVPLSPLSGSQLNSQQSWLDSASARGDGGELNETTSVYHIGTPTLVPSSANPSMSSGTTRISPIREESEDLGQMTTVKPVPGVKKEVSQVLKMIVLGDASVGKTALIQRFVNGTFQALPYKPTVGADFYSQKLEFTSKSFGETVFLTLQIWDTAGQERYKSLASSFYRGADICVIVEDCTRSSPLNTVAQWHEDFLRHAVPMDPETFPFVFLLNKSDLLSEADDLGALETSWQSSVAETFSVPKSRAALVSAKSGECVEEAFFLAAKMGAQRALNATNQVRRQQNAGLVINLNRSESDDDPCQC